MSCHADRILSAIETAAATSLIEASWRRCARVHCLDPDAIRQPAPDSIALREAEERDAAMIAIARPYLEQLFVALDDPLGGVSLVDRRGLMIAQCIGRTHDLVELRARHWLGSDVSESAIGTNGNGTCLVEERPVVVSGGDHFLSGLMRTICIAAPIFGPDGALRGCLNALTRPELADGRRMVSLVQVATRQLAQRIETELFAQAFAGTRLVMASPDGRNPGALLSVDRDGVVVGATRAARRLLALGHETLCGGIDLETLRGTRTPATIAEAESALIRRVLASHDGNVSAAARALGISRSTLYRKTAGLQRHAPG